MMSSMFLHAVILVAASAVTVALGLLVSRLSSRRLQGRARSDVLSSYVAVIGTLYAVLLAFVLLSVWEQSDAAHGASDREASAVADLARLTDGLPEAAAIRVRAAVRHYARAVIDDEWPRMAEGGRSERVDRALDEVWAALIGIEPPPGRAGVFNQALTLARSIGDARQDRLSQARPSVQPVIWVLLVGGGVLVLVSTYFFEVAPIVYLPVNGGLTLMIAFILYLIFAFDHPFSFDVGTGPDALRAVLEHLK
jgi:hypothetical protein